MTLQAGQHFSQSLESAYYIHCESCLLSVVTLANMQMNTRCKNVNIYYKCVDLQSQ